MCGTNSKLSSFLEGRFTRCTFLFLFLTLNFDHFRTELWLDDRWEEGSNVSWTWYRDVVENISSLLTENIPWNFAIEMFTNKCSQPVWHCMYDTSHFKLIFSPTGFISCGICELWKKRVCCFLNKDISLDKKKVFFLNVQIFCYKIEPLIFYIVHPLWCCTYCWNKPTSPAISLKCY